MKFNTFFYSVLTLILSFTSTGGELNFDEARQIVIQNGGRKKPLDTFAMESLQTITGRRAFRDPSTGQTVDPMNTLFSIWFVAEQAKKVPMILVSDPALRKELGLSETERKYSMQALLDNPKFMQMYEGIQKKQSRNTELTKLEKELDLVAGRIQLLGTIGSGEALTILPYSKEKSKSWGWLVGTDSKSKPLPEQIAFQGVIDAYLKRDPVGFTQSCRELRQILDQYGHGITLSSTAVKREIHFNHFHPFRWAWILYLASFLILLSPSFKRLGTALFAGGLILQTYGLILRCWIAGRPPVTNMYESVIWVTFGVAGFALIFAVIYRARIYVLGAAPLAIMGLILADLLPSVLNPNIAPLPPVLRDNFWLITHVLTITLGYAAFALAMGLGHIVLGGYIFKPSVVQEGARLHHLLYRVIQLGVLLLAAGTILGGVWANYSWGRFWGWDPKETWALIALLLYIFAIHGRIVRWWGDFGMAIASVVAFNGVLMAWYGVNFVLGKGLHSYGFGGGGTQWVGLFVVIDLLFLVLCILASRKKTS